MNTKVPRLLTELLPSECRIAGAMTMLGYGRFENLRIECGELILDPWPTTIRNVKFGSASNYREAGCSAGAEPKKQIIELFTYVRSTHSAVIRVLEFRGGLPFFMEVACAAEPNGEAGG